MSTRSEKDDIHVLQQKVRDLTESILETAKQYPVSAVEVAASSQRGYSVSVRKSEVDTLEYIRGQGLGITVYCGQRKGSASTTDFSKSAIQETLEAAMAIAKYTDEDPYAGLPDKADLAFDYPALDVYFPWQVEVESAIQMAKECEALAMAYDPRITNSEGASLTTYESTFCIGNSHGFMGGYPSTRHSIGCQLIAREGDEMQRDGDYTVARHAQDLMSIAEIAKRAGERCVSRLGSRRVATGKFPVLFHSEIASRLIGCFCAAIRGSSLYRKASFLLDALGKPIFPSFLQIQELPHLPKGLGSAPFDSEGVRTREQKFIEDGVLRCYELSSYSARKLGMKTTGNSGGVHNLTIQVPDAPNFEKMLKIMQKGLVVTELLGSGINTVTGDYSQGAVGFWVENGEIQFPVDEITIAGNLKDMFLSIVAVGNDIDFRKNIRTGSILIEAMTIAGE